MRTARIHNVRLGFANNSSSDHTLIFLRPGEAREEAWCSPEFGWEMFTLTSREEKAKYVALQFWEVFRVQFHPDREMARRFVEDLLPGVLEWKQKADGPEPEGYVDHQSLMDKLPAQVGTQKEPNLEFARDLRDFVLSDRVAVLGGNDNGDTHPTLEAGGVERVPVDFGSDFQRGVNIVARKDPKYGYWVLFNRETGARTRLSFADEGCHPKVWRASVPELVDLKVTDRCMNGCAYCYQGSTPTGETASFPKLKGIIKELAGVGVLEIAVGGGEPTSHPKFIDIGRECREHGMVANFTTRDIHYLGSGDMKVAMAYYSSCAYTVASPDEVTALSHAAGYHEKGQDWLLEGRLTAQYVMGSTPLEVLGDILTEAERCKVQVKLLGFKRQGRAETFQPYSYDEWVKQVLALDAGDRLDGGYPRARSIGIDTALARESESALKAAHVPKWFYTVEDGAFSMYVDAVAGKVGPSSFCRVEQYRPLKKGKLKETFEAFDLEGP